MASPRPRDQRPCDNCRRRRIRCLFGSDEAVDCVLCVSRATKCTYVQSAPRKKRATSANEDKEEASGSRTRPRPKAQKLTDTNVVRDYADLPGVSLLKETLGHQNRQSGEIVGATTDFDACLTTSMSWNARGECLALKPPQILRRANQSTFFMVTPDSQEEMVADFADLDEIEDFIAPHGPELVNLYFRIVHPSFPILHKKVFLEKHGRSYRELTPTGLGAVYIMALNWWSYGPALSDLPKPNSKELEAKVLRMLFDAHKRPKISDLQGGLVLMQCPNATSWAMTGHLLAMAQNLGINADCSDWHLPDWERGVRKRVAWALFMQDTWGALVYGRGSHIKLDDWDVKPLTASDFPETAIDDDDEEGSAEIEKGKQTFVHMVLLSEIVSQILNQFFTLKAARRQSTLQEVLERAKPLQLELKAWHSNIPKSLSIDDTVARKLSSVGYLHLAYLTAEITLHRAILRSHTHSLSNTPPELLSVTRLAAATRFTSTLDFLKRLKAEHLQSFWYFSSSPSLAIIGVFAAILSTTPSGNTSSDETERRTYLTQLAEYRWILRVSAKSADFIGTAVSLLDTRTQLLEQSREYQQRQQEQNPRKQQQQRQGRNKDPSASTENYISTSTSNNPTSNSPWLPSPLQSHDDRDNRLPPSTTEDEYLSTSPTEEAGADAEIDEDRDRDGDGDGDAEGEQWPPQTYDFDNPYYNVDWGDLVEGYPVMDSSIS